MSRIIPKKIHKYMFRGPLWPVTLALSFPMFISQLLQFFYSIVDTFFIAQIDKSSTALLSGPGLVFPLFFLALALGFCISTGVSAVVARGIGEKNEEIISNAADSGLLLALIISGGAVVLGYLYGGSFIKLLAGEKMSQEAIKYSLEYFYYLVPGLGLIILGHLFFGVLQGEGLVNKLAKALLISTLINLILDPIFIFWLNMGVKGAALATTVSILASSVYILQLFLLGKTEVPIHWNLFRAKAKLIGEILRIGVPQLLSILSLSLAFMFLNKLASSISQEAMNAWTICGRIDHILLLPAFAVSGATVAMVGQNYGKGNLKRVRQINLFNILVTLGAVFFLVIIYNLSAPFLFQIFSSVTEVINLCIIQVHWLSLGYIGVSGSIIIATTFQATGRSIPSFIIVFVRVGIIGVPLAYLMVNTFGLGIKGIFTALLIGRISSFLFAWIWVIIYLRHLKFTKALQ